MPYTFCTMKFFSIKILIVIKAVRKTKSSLNWFYCEQFIDKQFFVFTHYKENIDWKIIVRIVSEKNKKIICLLFIYQIIQLTSYNIL